MSAPRDWLSPRVLDGIALACGGLAVVLLMLPASTSIVPAEVRVPSVESTAASEVAQIAAGRAALDSARQSIVRTNAFSASRREPSVRFVAPGMEPQPTMPSAFDVNRETTTAVDAGPRLFGIVSVSGTPRALLQVRSGDEPPRLLAIGESYAGVRVVRIGDDRVVISSSSGTRTLRLSRVVPDSSEKVP
jgi:hypothetical protein